MWLLPVAFRTHSLFSIWKKLTRSEKIPGAPTRRWGEWIWLTGPTGLHRNSPHGLNISSIRVLTRSEIRKSQWPFAHYRTDIFKVYFPRAGPSLRAQELRLQFCRWQVFHRKLRNKSCSFARYWIGAVACRCFPHSTLSSASEHTLKDIERSQVPQRGGDESGFG